MSNKIDQLIGTGVIEKTKGDYIKEKFQDFTQSIEEWSEKANAILVTDETQKEVMLEAREGRLLLKAKRIEVEKVRKSLKEQSLNEGRLIDSVAKYLTSLIEPAEKHLEIQEKFIEIQEQNKRIEIKAKRTALLEPYIEVIDPNLIQLDLITEEAFTTILNGAKFSLENKKAEALRLEEELLEINRKQNLFQERSLQIAQYKKYYNQETDLSLNIETTTIEFNMLLQNLINRYAQEVIRQDEIAKENEKLKKGNEKKAEEIKKLKKEIKQTPNINRANFSELNESFIDSTTNKTFTSDNDENSFINNLDVSFTYVENGNENTIIVNKSDYELLRKRYSISKIALESVLGFIVPINLRNLVYNAIKEISEMK